MSGDLIECTKCRRQLPADHYSRNSQSKTGLQKRCKDCVKEYRDQYRSRPEVQKQRSESARRYRQDPAVRARMAEATKAFAAKHHATRECVADGCTRWNHQGSRWCAGHTLRVSQWGDPRLDIPLGGATRSDPAQPTSVYVAIDTDGAVRYVGMTADMSRRRCEHRGRSAWFSESIAWAVKEFATIDEASTEEARLIKKHQSTVLNQQQGASWSFS